MSFVSFFRFVLVGGLATVIQYVVLILLVQLIGADPVFASAVGFVISAVANYIINYHYTFGSNQRHTSAITKFTALASVGLVLNSGIMSALVRLGLHYLPAQIVATVIVLLWNFAGNSLWTFRADADRKELEVVNKGDGFHAAVTRNKSAIWALLFTVCVRAIVSLISNNEPGDADARAIESALWALHPSLIYSGVWLPFHFYVTGTFALVLGDPIVAGKWVSFLTGSLSVVPFFRLVRRFFDERTALIAALLFAIYGNHVGLSSIVMSEAPFCFFALWGLDVFFAEMHSTTPRWRGFLAAGILVALAGGFRQEGWLLAGILSIFMLAIPRVRSYAVPFGLIGISTLIMWTVGNAVAGHGLLRGLLAVAAAKDHEALYIQYSAATNIVKWVWIFVQSPGPVISVLAVSGFYMALQRRLPYELAMVAILIIGPFVVLSVVKPQWAPQHRYAVLFGILILPYAAAATRVFVEKKYNIHWAVAAILILSVATQAAAYQRHSRRSLPFHDYELVDVDSWKWLAANTRPNDLVVVEDTEWRAPGLIAHSGLYRQKFEIIFDFEKPEKLEKLTADRDRSYVLVLHSPASKWGFLTGLNPTVVFRNRDYSFLRVEAKSQ